MDHELGDSGLCSLAKLDVTNVDGWVGFLIRGRNIHVSSGAAEDSRRVDLRLSQGHLHPSSNEQLDGDEKDEETRLSIKNSRVCVRLLTEGYSAYLS
jgi:hypothetical protein